MYSHLVSHEVALYLQGHYAFLECITGDFSIGGHIYFALNTLFHPRLLQR